jgi:hypothetical protein
MDWPWKITLLFTIIAGCFVFSGVWLVWILVGRPFAVTWGMIPPTAYDHLVRGWQAERRGAWARALAEYQKALELNPRHPDVHLRLNALLAAHPELTQTQG